MSEKPQYVMQDVWKRVDSPSGQLEILRGVSLEIQAGESLAIVGASGSGKSTLLHVLGALDTPSQGNVYYKSCDLTALNPSARAAFRNRTLGFVFQFHHLLPEFSTVENVAMPAVIGGMDKRRARELAGEALERVGLAHRRDYSVTTLSGGERQRAAIARATLLGPRVLLADEPTGNLDEKNGVMVAELLLELNRDRGMSLVVVTHNRELASGMGRCLELRSGELYEQSCL